MHPDESIRLLKAHRPSKTAAYRCDRPADTGLTNPLTHNVAVKKSDAETGSTPRVVQFRHPWAPTPGTKSDRVGAPGNRMGNRRDSIV